MSAIALEVDTRKALKVYGIINCLNKNLITHVVWYLEKEIRCDIKTLLWKCAPNHTENVHQKLVSDPFPILLYNLKHPLHKRSSFRNNILKENCQKPLKKLTLFFPLNPVPFNWQSYQKQKESGTSEQSLFRLWEKFRKIPLFVLFYLTKFDDVM